MELFKVIVSNDVKEFERLVNEAMNDGYILMEGNQVLIVNKEPTEYQFVRHLLHRDYFYHNELAKQDGHLRAAMEFYQVNKDVIVKNRSMLQRIDAETYDEHKKWRDENRK